MADYQYLNENGVVVPDTLETLTTVQNEFLTIFGPELDLSFETPQGLLIAAETKARDQVIKNNAALANQINPNLAGGIFLDAIWALTGGKRVAATPTLVRDVIMTGRPFTVVPAQSLAQSGETSFELIETVILDKTGKATGHLQAQVNGPIAVTKNSLNQIVTPVLGLETITNPNEGELGRNEESDQAARLRRRNTLALQAVALPEAIVSGLYDVEGVKSLQFYENYSDKTITIEDVSLKPHSIYLCVDGGRDQDIATMLLHKKSLGCGFNGKKTLSVIEPISQQSYQVQFDRPDSVNIFVMVELQRSTTISAPEEAVRDAILRYSAGEMAGERGFSVGNDVSAFELAGAINRDYPSLFVKKVKLSRDGNHYDCETIPIKINQIANLQRGSIGVDVQ